MFEQYLIDTSSSDESEVSETSPLNRNINNGKSDNLDNQKVSDISDANNAQLTYQNIIKEAQGYVLFFSKVHSLYTTIICITMYTLLSLK